MVDIPSRKPVHAPVDHSEDLFRLAFENANVGMCIVSLEGKILRANRQLCEMFGYSKSELEGMSVNDVAHPDSVHVSADFIQRSLSGGEDHAECDKNYIHKQGHTVNGHVASSLVRDSAGNPIFYVSHVSDMTERIRLEDEVRRMAFNDPLTHLANRSLLNDHLAQALANSRRNGVHGALLFLDLDNFKPLNDAHGHDVGDLLLLEVAERLKSCVREVDMELAESNTQAGRIAEKIRVALARPYLLTTTADQKSRVIEHRCTASIGVVVFLGYDITPEDVLKWADTAMYEAKAAGRNAVRFHL